MAYRKCPSCGQRYNGKRCKHCYYEPYGEVRTSFDLHREEETPKREASWQQVPQPQRRAAPVRPAFPTRTRKQSETGKTILKRLGTIWAVILLLTGLVPTLLEAFWDVGSSFVEATPETIPMPNSGVVLYEDADILVLADWDGTPIDSDIPIFVQNFTGEDLTVCTDGVAVNGCMVEDVFFYCDAYRDSVSRATLWVDMETLGERGIKEGQYIQMTIDVTDEDYNVLVDDAPVTLGSEYTQELSDSGMIIYDQDGFRLVYKGMYEDQFGDPLLVFYGENATEHWMELSSNELWIDGEETGCWLWQKFLPGTRGIFYGYIHDDLVLPDNALCEVELFLTPDRDWEQEIDLGVLNFPLD